MSDCWHSFEGLIQTPCVMFYCGKFQMHIEVKKHCMVCNDIPTN